MRLLLIQLSLASVAACAGTQHKSTLPAASPGAAQPVAAGAAAARAVEVARETVAAAAQESLLDFVPAQALAVVVVRRGIVGRATELLLSEPTELRDDLRSFLGRVVGDDLTRVEGIVAFASRLRPQLGGALVLRINSDGPRPALRGPTVARHRGVALVALRGVGKGIVAAQLPRGVAMGLPSAVKAVLDLVAGKAASLAADHPLGDLVRYDAPDLDFVAGVRADSLMGAAPMLAGFGARSATLTVDRKWGVTLRVAGDPKALDQGRKGLVGISGMLVGQREAAMKEAVRGHDVAEGVAAIISYYRLRELISEAQPVMEDERLVSRLAVPQGAGIAVPLMGVLAAVAIPAFNKYLKRAKAAEARATLQLLQSRLTIYHAERAKRAKRRFRFPRGTPWTPRAGCCGGPNKKCPASAAGFEHPSWRALSYAPTEPFSYQLRLTSSGRGKSAKVTVEARADLECNGQTSQLELRGALDSNGELSFSPIK